MDEVWQVIREASGGMVTHLVTLLEGIDAAGLRARVAGPARVLQMLARRRGAAWVPSHGIPIRLGDGHPLWAEAASAVGLRRLLRAASPPPAVLHAHGYHAAMVSRLALRRLSRPHRPALVVTLHNLLPVAGDPSARLAWAAARWALGGASAVIGVSHATYDLALAVCGERWPTHGIWWIPNGYILPAHEDPVPAGPPQDERRRSQHLDGGAVHITCMARLVESKGLDVLVEALRRLPAGLPQWHVHIVGEGPLRGALERHIQGAGLADRVTLEGAVEQTGAIWVASDIAVLPSGSEGGVPYALLEAMAHGLPIVAADGAGCREALRGGALGRLVRPGDAAELAAALAPLVACPSCRWRWGRRAQRGVAAHYDARKTMWPATMALYRRLGAGGAGGRADPGGRDHDGVDRSGGEPVRTGVALGGGHP